MNLPAFSRLALVGGIALCGAPGRQPPRGPRLLVPAASMGRCKGHGPLPLSCLLLVALSLSLFLSPSALATATSSSSSPSTSSSAAETSGDEFSHAAVLARPGALPTDNFKGALLTAQEAQGSSTGILRDPETQASGIPRDPTSENAAAADAATSATAVVSPEEEDATAAVAMIRGGLQCLIPCTHRGSLEARVRVSLEVRVGQG